MRFLLFASMFAILFSHAGCGPGQVSVYSVKGKLTRSGYPLGDVHLMLSPAEAGDRLLSSADVGLDGSFELKCSDGRMGAAAGSYKVVLANKVTDDGMAGMKEAMEKMKGKSGPPDMSKMMSGGDAPFPAEYSDPKTSPKTVEVKAEDQTLNIDI